jgi:hypothetical protein
VAALDKAKRALVSLMRSLAIAYGCLTTDGALRSVRKYHIAVTIVPSHVVLNHAAHAQKSKVTHVPESL